VSGVFARRLRRVLLTLIGALYIVSIPWYRNAGERASLWLGLPDWVAVALLCYAGVAVLNSIAWLLSDIPDAADADDHREGEPR